MAKSTPKLHDTSRRVKLTRDAARRADCLRDAKGNYVRQRVYWDTDNKGFGLVANKESKTWIAQARVNGVPKRITIGQYGDSWTVDKARKEAAELLASMRKGNDPTAGDPDSVTLGEAWEVFKEALHAEGAAPKTLRRYEHCVTHYLKTWLPRPLASITRGDVRRRHHELAKEIDAGKYAQRTKRGRKLKPYNRTGQTTANDVFRVLRALWNSALLENERLPANPCINVRWFKGHEGKHEAIPTGELPSWYATVQQIENHVRRDYLLFMLFTGLRAKSASEVRWKDVDLDRRMLHIPNPKGGKERAFDLPLTDHIIGLLKERCAENEKLAPRSPWVFPADSATGHLTSPPRVAIGDARYNPHRLRATFITIAEGLNVSPYAIKRLVNHAWGKGDVTESYIGRDVERLRAPMQQITDRLLIMLESGGPANVVELRPMAEAAAA